jgi:hypothetical protein
MDAVATEHPNPAGIVGTLSPKRPYAHKRTKARQSNRPEHLDRVDGRLAIVRRYRDVAAAILVDLGGADNVTEVKLGLVRRFAGCVALAEQIEQRMAQGEAISLPEYALLASTMTRLAGRIGLSRIARDLGVVPSLAAYLNAIAGETKTGETKGDFVSADEAAE